MHRSSLLKPHSSCSIPPIFLREYRMKSPSLEGKSKKRHNQLSGAALKSHSSSILKFYSLSPFPNKRSKREQEVAELKKALEEEAAAFTRWQCRSCGSLLARPWES